MLRQIIHDFTSSFNVSNDKDKKRQHVNVNPMIHDKDAINTINRYFSDGLGFDKRRNKEIRFQYRSYNQKTFTEQVLLV